MAPVVPPSFVTDAGRLEALEHHAILDTAPEPAFDAAVLLARTLCGAPIALISLVADDRQWFKARSGFGPEQTTLDESVCAHALGLSGFLVIPDLRADPRTEDNPLVTGDAHIRFYAGSPLRVRGGHVLGTLCVLDTVPRPYGLLPEQAEGLRALTTMIGTLLDGRGSMHPAATAQDQADVGP